MIKVDKILWESTACHFQLKFQVEKHVFICCRKLLSNNTFAAGQGAPSIAANAGLWAAAHCAAARKVAVGVDRYFPRDKILLCMYCVLSQGNRASPCTAAAHTIWRRSTVHVMRELTIKKTLETRLKQHYEEVLQKHHLMSIDIWTQTRHPCTSADV